MAPKTPVRPASKKASRRSIVGDAARRWHVPFYIMWGVYGIETAWGANVATSSAGAGGDFQFMPATAATYGVNINSLHSSANGAGHYLHDLHAQYGNWDTALQHYSGGGYGLSDVKAKAATKGVSRQTPAPTSAGAGGVAVPVDIVTPFGTVPAPGPNLDFTSPFGPLSPLNAIPGVGGGGSSAIPGLPGTPGTGGGANIGSILNFPDQLIRTANTVTDFLTMLSSIKFWIRVGEALGAVILLYIGLKALTGQDIPGAPAAKSAARDFAMTAAAAPK